MIYKHLLYDIYNNELTILKTKKNDEKFYYAGYLPIYKHQISGLEIHYGFSKTKQKLCIHYSLIEIEKFGFSTVQEHYLNQLNLTSKDIGIERLRVSEKTYNKLFEIAEKNDGLPIDKRTKITLKDLLSSMVSVN